jgi:Ras-related protein Rab-18
VLARRAYFTDFYDDDTRATIGIDFIVKEISIDGKRVKFQIWDSEVKHRFQSVASSYYRNCSGIIIVMM